jgi:hypothetical protein
MGGHKTTMDRSAAHITNRETETELNMLGDEVLERWGVAMAAADKALIGQLVQRSHAIRDARRTLAAEVSAPARLGKAIA